MIQYLVSVLAVLAVLMHLTMAIRYPFIRLFADTSLPEKLLKFKTGKNKFAIWYYQGYIRDPANGKNVVAIEGIEKIQSLHGKNLSSILDGNNSSTVLSNNLSTSSSTYLSHKIFLYVDANNRSSPLTGFRKTRMAPLRKVNPFNSQLECVHIDIDNSNSSSKELNLFFGSNSEKIRAGSVTDSLPARLSSTVFWPGGRCIEGKLWVEKLEEHPRGRVSSSGWTIHHSVRGRKKKRTNRWIAFGPDNDEANMGKSNEVYQLHDSTGPSLPQSWKLIGKKSSSAEPFPLSQVSAWMYYKRYGNSPAWLAPQKPCEIELRGYRLSRLNEVPRSTRELFMPYASDFLNDQPPSLKSMQEKSKDPLSQFTPWYTKAALLFSR